jgi:hypothetical protein
LCDATFKTSPKFYYQHYIIHGKYNDAWPLPACYSFLSGKWYEICDMMFKYTNSNVYKILDVLRKQETLTGNKFERLNLVK